MLISSCVVRDVGWENVITTDKLSPFFQLHPRPGSQMLEQMIVEGL